jgi:hypothetical protein
MHACVQADAADRVTFESESGQVVRREIRNLGRGEHAVEHGEIVHVALEQQVWCGAADDEVAKVELKRKTGAGVAHGGAVHKELGVAQGKRNSPGHVVPAHAHAREEAVQASALH